MKTLTITEAKDLLRKLTEHAVEENKRRAERALPMERFRICPKCKEVLTEEYCICRKDMH